MAVTFATGFEGQQDSIDSVTFQGSGVTPSTAQSRTGVASLRCNAVSSTITGFVPSSTITGGWIHFGIYVATLPSATRTIAGNISNGWVGLTITPAGAIEVWTNGANLGTSSAISTGTWHWIGFRNNTGTGVSWLQVDGADAGISGNGTISSGLQRMGIWDGVAANPAGDIYYDDVIADSAGFLAPSKVDIALPISDNTRTAVTTGNGGTTNLWDAVNNTPPTGVVSASETATTNIEYPASLTEDYIANLETYTTLGISASDTVLAVQ